MVRSATHRQVLKICWSQARAGSSPVRGTELIKGLAGGRDCRSDDGVRPGSTGGARGSVILRRSILAVRGRPRATMTPSCARSATTRGKSPTDSPRDRCRRGFDSGGIRFSAPPPLGAPPHPERRAKRASKGAPQRPDRGKLPCPAEKTPCVRPAANSGKSMETESYRTPCGE